MARVYSSGEEVYYGLVLLDFTVHQHHKGYKAPKVNLKM